MTAGTMIALDDMNGETIKLRCWSNCGTGSSLGNQPCLLAYADWEKKTWLMCHVPKTKSVCVCFGSMARVSFQAHQDDRDLLGLAKRLDRDLLHDCVLGLVHVVSPWCCSR